MRYKKVLDKVLETVVPSKQEEKKVKKVVSAFVSLLNSLLKKAAVDAKAVAGGSFAKGVWLSGDFDVDVFVKFNLKKYRDVNISDLLEKVLLHFSPVRVHGSRDYFVVENQVHFEVVPVLDIKKPEDACNVTDFSPLHVSWVKKNGKPFLNDIRLAKLFCKACNCYGAESYIRGFSGHVLDVLVIHFKGFIPLLKAASKWKPKVVVDHYRFHKGRALFNLNKSKTQGPLIVVDPVDPFRNAAAALSKENFSKFIRTARSFLKRPSEDFFVPKKPDFNKLSKKGHLFFVEVKTLNAKPDVAGAKFVRAFEFVKKELGDFGVVDSGWEWDKKSRGLWWFVLKHDELPVFFELKGPPVNLKDSVVAFKKKHKSVFVRNGRLFAKVKRDLTSAFDVLLQALGSDFVVGRVRSAKVGLV